MAYGLNTPSYGYQKAGGGSVKSPYYRVAAALRSGTSFAPAPGGDLFQSPLISTSAAAVPAPRISQYTAPTDTAAAGDTTQQPAAQPAAPKQPGGQGQPAQPQAPASLMYDYRTDPILQQIQAVSVQSRQGADTRSLDLGKQLAIRYGDAGFAKNVLHDNLTGQAAEQNPYSVFAQLKKNQQADANQLDESLNKQNLFYGGHRIVQQGKLADQYQAQQAAETANMQDAYNAIQQNRLAAYLNADQQDQQAQQDAYNRALQAALAAGYSYGDPGATDTSGTDVTSTPAPADGNPDPGWGAPIPTEARGGGGIDTLLGALAGSPTRPGVRGNADNARVALDTLGLFGDMSTPGTSYGPPTAAKTKASAGARAALNELARALRR